MLYVNSMLRQSDDFNLFTIKNANQNTFIFLNVWCRYIIAAYKRANCKILVGELAQQNSYTDTNLDRLIRTLSHAWSVSLHFA